MFVIAYPGINRSISNFILHFPMDVITLHAGIKVSLRGKRDPLS